MVNGEADDRQQAIQAQRGANKLLTGCPITIKKRFVYANGGCTRREGMEIWVMVDP